ncbi:MAG: helix-turn-helix transcriptional regulator [Magnetospirillum sp.]|nr:helix-turn-helix transcriptional regulator [Magnetospirillum sp.]
MLYRTKKEAADTADISPDQLARYIKGQNAAPFGVLARIAAAKAVSLDWLASGKGQMRLADAASAAPVAEASPAVDTGLYGRVLEQVAAVYQECGITASLAQIGANAAEIAGDLSSPDFTTNSDQTAALKYAITQLRRTLQTANHTKPGDAQGKQRA